MFLSIDGPPKGVAPAVREFTSLFVCFFRRHTMGEKHNLCCVFVQNLFSTLLLHLVNSSHHGAIGSVSAWQTKSCGFEPVTMSYMFSKKHSSS